MRTNETFGVTAERALCQLAELECTELDSRADDELQELITPTCKIILEKLPPLGCWVGSNAGSRGGRSKSSVDFLTVDERTVSLKTNFSPSDKVCPPEVGQPGRETFETYFGHLGTPPIFVEGYKQMCVERFDKMLPIYAKHLLDADFLVWIGLNRRREVSYAVIPRPDLSRFPWTDLDYTFTRGISEWKSSSTVKVAIGGKRVTLGEFQVHGNRGSYKFRINLRTLLRLIGVDLHEK